jgi:hypothetical protein
MTAETLIGTIYDVADDLRSLIAPLPWPEKVPSTFGPAAVSYRLIFEGIIYVLHTGC